MKVTAAGSGGTNAGIIKATAATDSTITIVILTGAGESESAIFSVPANQYLLLNDVWFTINRGTASGVNADVILFVKENADTTTPSWAAKWRSGAYLDSLAHVRDTFSPRLEIPAKSDIKIQVQGCSANDTPFTAGFDGELVKEDVVL